MPNSPSTADQPTRALYREEPEHYPQHYAQQPAPKRTVSQRVEKLPSGGAAWLQAVSVAIIALLMLITFSFAAITAVKAQVALKQLQQQQQQYQQNCGVNPSTGLIECR